MEKKYLELQNELNKSIVIVILYSMQMTCGCTIGKKYW